jgi:hypothetical protein
MAISIIVNGSKSRGNAGFLLAPAGKQEFPMPVALKTTDGTTVNATLAVVAPAGVVVELSQTSVSIGPTTKTVKITAKNRSKKAGDITLVVKAKSKVLGKYVLTSISNARIRFAGRFQARFATDGDFFNEPRGTNIGWQFALEGEPDFVPSVNNIPTQPGMAVGRVVRFQNPVPLRSHVAPIGVKVKAVEGQVGANIPFGRTVTVSFTVGDPIIGEAVSLGPNTFLSANSPAPPGPQQPFEQFPPGLEPMENFELNIGTRFSGKPATLNDRPKANGFLQLTSAELTKYGVVPLSQFSNQRKTQLLTDYHALSPADRTGTPSGRNLATRIGHLGGSPPDSIPSTTGTLPPGWSGKEVYNGNVNNSIQITPGNSVVMSYFKLFKAFRFSGTLLNFHSDEQCGQVDGALQPLTAILNRQME